MKWKVTVQRVEYRSAEFVVDADDADEAEDKGLEASCDHDFSVNTVDHAEEDVTSARSAAEALKQGIPCEVAEFTSEMTNIMPRYWLDFDDFKMSPSENPGWVVYTRKTGS